MLSQDLAKPLVYSWRVGTNVKKRSYHYLGVRVCFSRVAIWENVGKQNPIPSTGLSSCSFIFPIHWWPKVGFLTPQFQTIPKTQANFKDGETLADEFQDMVAYEYLQSEIYEGLLVEHGTHWDPLQLLSA